MKKIFLMFWALSLTVVTAKEIKSLNNFDVDKDSSFVNPEMVSKNPEILTTSEGSSSRPFAEALEAIELESGQRSDRTISAEIDQEKKARNGKIEGEEEEVKIESSNIHPSGDSNLIEERSNSRPGRDLEAESEESERRKNEENFTRKKSEEIYGFRNSVDEDEIRSYKFDPNLNNVKIEKRRTVEDNYSNEGVNEDSSNPRSDGRPEMQKKNLEQRSSRREGFAKGTRMDEDQNSRRKEDKIRFNEEGTSRRSFDFGRFTSSEENINKLRNLKKERTETYNEKGEDGKDIRREEIQMGRRNYVRTLPKTEEYEEQRPGFEYDGRRFSRNPSSDSESQEDRAFQVSGFHARRSTTPPNLSEEKPQTRRERPRLSNLRKSEENAKSRLNSKRLQRSRTGEDGGARRNGNTGEAERREFLINERFGHEGRSFEDRRRKQRNERLAGEKLQNHNIDDGRNLRGRNDIRHRDERAGGRLSTRFDEEKNR